MHNPKSSQGAAPDGLAQRQDEVFDVVDAEDRVVRQATRGEIHRRGWMHRAVHVLVFDEAGRVFLQLRSRHKDTSPGKWDSSCSGHVDAGEGYDAAARRELGEELGIGGATGELVLLLTLTPRAETGWEFVRVYRLEYSGPFRLNSAEIEDGRWITPAMLIVEMREVPDQHTSASRLIWSLLSD